MPITNESFGIKRNPAVSAGGITCAAVLLPLALGCSSGASGEESESRGGNAGAGSAGGGGLGGVSGSSTATGGESGGSGAAATAGGAGMDGAGGMGGAGTSGGGRAGTAGISGTSGEAGVGVGGGGGAAGASGGAAGAAAGNVGMGGAGTGSGGNAGDGAGCVTGSVAAQCTRDGNEVACHLGGNPGNYQVTVTLGGERASSSYIEVEMYRRVLEETTLAAGQTVSASFVVNVRQPEGQPIQNGSNEGRSGLDVYVRGTAPELSAICFEPLAAPLMLWIGGDSTVCDQSGTDYSGWAQHLPRFFAAPVSIANYADSGESSGSFLNGAALFGAIEARWQPGDWFFLQLGHNDKNTAAATFEANMTSFVTQAKAAGVNIVLVTPIARVGGALAEQHVNSTGANLPQIIRDLGERENVPVIDLTVSTWNWLQTITWQDHFALGTDRTHPNPKGAAAIAELVRDAIVSQELEIASQLR
jgi:lysophospholipase L1-like esterase